MGNNNKKIIQYINTTNKIIKDLKIKKELLKGEKHFNKELFYIYRKELIEKLGLDYKSFFVSSDIPKNKEEIEILKKVLTISDKVIYITNDLKKVISLKNLFPEKVYEYKVDKYKLAATTDIHIYFWDDLLLDLLFVKNKIFNPVHPTKLAVNNTKFEDIDKEFLQFAFGKNAEKLKSWYDFYNFIYNQILENSEIDRMKTICGIDRLIFFIELALKKKEFLKNLSNFHHLIYTYHKTKINKNDYDSKNCNKFFINKFLNIFGA